MHQFALLNVGTRTSTNLPKMSSLGERPMSIPLSQSHGDLLCSSNAMEGVCDSPADMTEELVDNGSECTARLADLYSSAKFSDITLVVGTERFTAHRLILASGSDVFEQMLTSEHWMDSDQKEFSLTESEDCVAAFGSFLRYIYSGQVNLTTQNVLGLLVLADKYNVPGLKECCSGYMTRHLVSTPDNNKAITWYQYAIACNSLTLQESCFSYIVLNADTVIQSPDWIYLEKENLILILQRSDLLVESEYTILKAVVRWLTFELREAEMRSNLESILPYIRFPMILPEHLSEFEESQFEQEYHDLISPYLLAAYRYHSLSIKGRKEHMLTVPRAQFLYRNYTDDNYSISVDVIRKCYRSCPRVSSKVEKPLSLPVNISNTAQDKQCKMKVTFYPQGYYTTSLWNGQLNLAKSTDQTKMVIAHRGGLELHEAEISIITYAYQQGLRYAVEAFTEPHIFETYGTFEVENVIDLNKLKVDNSMYISNGSLYVKVFLRPISFQRTAHNAESM